MLALFSGFQDFFLFLWKLSKSVLKVSSSRDQRDESVGKVLAMHLDTQASSFDPLESSRWRGTHLRSQHS